MIGSGASSSPPSRTSPTTPTTVSGRRSPSMLPNWMRCPIGSRSPKRARATDAEITATGGSSAASRGSKARPRSTGIPIAAK
jgi:hypothetical protein